MSSEEWRKEYENKYVHLEEIGDSITGIFTEVRETEYMGRLNYRPVLTVNGEERIFPSHVALLRALTVVEYGTEIEITLKDRVKNKYGKQTNIYHVEKVEK